MGWNGEWGVDGWGEGKEDCNKKRVLLRFLFYFYLIGYLLFRVVFSFSRFISDPLLPFRLFLFSRISSFLSNIFSSLKSSSSFQTLPPFFLKPPAPLPPFSFLFSISSLSFLSSFPPSSTLQPLPSPSQSYPTNPTTIYPLPSTTTSSSTCH